MGGVCSPGLTRNSSAATSWTNNIDLFSRWSRSRRQRRST